MMVSSVPQILVLKRGNDCDNKYKPECVIDKRKVAMGDLPSMYVSQDSTLLEYLKMSRTPLVLP